MLRTESRFGLERGDRDVERAGTPPLKRVKPGASQQEITYTYVAPTRSSEQEANEHGPRQWPPRGQWPPQEDGFETRPCRDLALWGIKYSKRKVEVGANINNKKFASYCGAHRRRWENCYVCSTAMRCVKPQPVGKRASQSRDAKGKEKNLAVEAPVSMDGNGNCAAEEPASKREPSRCAV